MKKTRYEPEILDEETDDGTMPHNVATLADAVVGHFIVHVEKGVALPPEVDVWGRDTGTAITLSNGKRVFLIDTDDCCAFTQLDDFLLHPENVDHIVTGVGTTEGYQTWHIYADYGDILTLKVGWSPGNPFYYGYGFNITVVDPEYMPPHDHEVEAAIRSIQEGL